MLDIIILLAEDPYREESQSITILNGRDTFAKSKIELSAKTRINCESTLGLPVKKDLKRRVDLVILCRKHGIQLPPRGHWLKGRRRPSRR